MSERSRKARRKLAAHDRGVDRHNKGVMWLKVRKRLGKDSGMARVSKRADPGQRQAVTPRSVPLTIADRLDPATVQRLQSLPDKSRP